MKSPAFTGNVSLGRSFQIKTALYRCFASRTSRTSSDPREHSYANEWLYCLGRVVRQAYPRLFGWHNTNFVSKVTYTLSCLAYRAKICPHDATEKIAQTIRRQASK